MARNILLFDVGNTNIKIGVAPREACGGVSASYTLPTDARETVDSLGIRILSIGRHFGLKDGDVDGCAACSVVPSMDSTLAGACERYLGATTLFAPRDIPVPMDNHYARPQEVGADRLVTAYAGHMLFPAHGHIVVDFGTATTFDCVAGDAYLGGLICPGVLSSARALATQTAKLPQIRLEDALEEAGDPPVPGVGKSTSQSLSQGLLFGFAAMAEGVVQRLKAMLPVREQDVAVVATGGLAPLIAKVCRAFDQVHPDLLLEGLCMLYREREAHSG